MTKLAVTGIVFVVLLVHTVSVPNAIGADTALNFLGSTKEETTRRVPDTSGTVGRDHIVLFVHSVYKVWNKHDLRDDDELPVNDRLCGPTPNNLNNVTCVPADELPLNTFWDNALPDGEPLGAFTIFDPRVIYDPYDERYLAVSSYDPTTPNDFLIAVSNTSNPLEGWTAHRIDSDSNDARWVDFPTVSVSRDAVIMGAHMLPVNHKTHVPDVSILAMDKDALYSGQLTLQQYKVFENTKSVTGRLPHPVMDLEDSALPASLLTAETDTSGDDSVKRTTVNGIGANDTVQYEDDIDVNELEPAPNGRQPENADPLFNINGPDSSIPPLLSSYPVKQNGFLWGVQGREDSSDPSNPYAAIRWFKIDPSDDSLVNEGLISGSITNASNQEVDHADLLFPSIAVNKFGDVVVGFTATSEDLHASSYAAVGEVDGTDVEFDEIQPMQSGNGVVNWENSDPYPWGHYSATVVDPVNPYRFWTFQELVNADDQWGVQVTEIEIRDNLIGDMDFDMDVDLDDIDEFVLALRDRDAYFPLYGAREQAHGDVDGDNDLDLDDVDDFVDVLTGGSAGSGAAVMSSGRYGPVPEPSSLSLVGAAIVATVVYVGWRPRTRRGWNPYR